MLEGRCRGEPTRLPARGRNGSVPQRSGPRKAGLDRALTLQALGGGLAGSKCLEQKTSNYVAGTYHPGFKVDLHCTNDRLPGDGPLGSAVSQMLARIGIDVQANA